MALLLAIETSTKNCSVALFKNGDLLQLREQNSDKYLHAEKLTLFIEDVIKRANINLKDTKPWIHSKKFTGKKSNFYYPKTLKEANSISINKKNTH